MAPDGGTHARVDDGRLVGVVGRLGVYPLVRLSLPARRILAYLALRGQPVARRVAAADLWPDVPDDCARTNLRRSVWHLPAGWVASVGDELHLQAQTDLAAAHAAAARALDGLELTLADITLLSDDVLPGWHDEWVLAQQEAFRLLRVQALEAACRTMRASGHLALSIQAGAAALAAEPLCESAAEALIDAYLAQSNRHQARQCFLSLAGRLRSELGVAPQPGLLHRLDELGLGERVAGLPV
ncbi:MAG: transcriptional regulator [Comamonadaceae bacterium]|nr:MAG: transcriptional regulator [Comamonadaceae bacterium]